jgi:LysM repeat protein
VVPTGLASVKTPEGAQTYEVKPGETLGAIARKFHVKTQDLLVANNIADPRKIRPGQNLVIPAGGTSAVAGPAIKLSPAAPAAPGSAAANTGTSVTPPPPVLDSGVNPPVDVPVIKVDDSSETKTP